MNPSIENLSLHDNLSHERNNPPSSPVHSDSDQTLKEEQPELPGTPLLTDSFYDEYRGKPSSGARTYKPGSRPKGRAQGTMAFHLRQYAQATLGDDSLKQVVKLPEGEDVNEWLAVNLVDFFNQINLLYGAITEFCSPQGCPEMKATDEFEYLWQDNDKYKKPAKMSAPEYIEHLMAWVQNSIDNDDIFPSKIGVPFPKSFQPLVKQFFKRLFRVYAHIYCHHYPVIAALNLDQHLNTSFKHFVLFVTEFDLAQGKDYFGPLADLVESMTKES